MNRRTIDEDRELRLASRAAVSRHLENRDAEREFLGRPDGSEFEMTADELEAEAREYDARVRAMNGRED